MLYDVEIGKDTWVRHHDQLRRRLAEPTTDKRYLSLYLILDTFNLTRVLPLRSQLEQDESLLVSRLIHPRRPTGDLPKKGDVRRNDNYSPPLSIFLL
ncbi:hypothetical protein ACTXT7_015870 [Hymenolepis weldensis]